MTLFFIHQQAPTDHNAMANLQLVIFVAIFVGAVTSQNFVTVTETEGVAVTNYPFQFASPFLPGEIAPYPLVLINGQAVVTQANVKQRYPDGSVKHAIMSVVIPAIPANGAVNITFSSQDTAQDTPISKQDLLDARFNFDATMELSNSATITASARTMLQNDDYTVWAGGSVATTIILADHSASRAYDIGFDANKSFRPIFHATFWSSLNMVFVRYIGELAHTETLQNIVVTNLVLKAGSSSPQVVYSLPGALSPLTMSYASRWTKVAWIGGSVSTKLNIYHNLDYLAQTRFVFNYDTTKVVPEAAIASLYQSWGSAGRDLYQAGQWTKAQGTAGGRPDIGPYPNWAVQWLYTGDWRAREATFGNADLAGAWPVHFREGNAAKRFLRSDSTDGTALGRILSIAARPTIRTADITYSYTVVADRVTIVGSTTTDWIPDIPHSPEIWSPIYALTGDFWYLESLWFWASYGASESNGAANAYVYGRGPTGAEGGLSGQVRGQAWCLRTRVNAAYVTPDDQPEQTYFNVLTEDAIAIEDGARNFLESPYYNTPTWNWGNTIRHKVGGNLGSVDGTLPALNQWIPGDPAFAQAGYGVDTAVVKAALSLFEQNFLMLALGRARELGFNCTLLVNYLGQFYTNALTDSGFNPYILGNGRLPTIRLADSKYFSTFADLRTGYTAEWSTASSFDLGDTTHGYPFIALAAVSMTAHLPNGPAGWEFMKNNVLVAPLLDSNPKWAILPRAESDIPQSPLQSSPYVYTPSQTQTPTSGPAGNDPAAFSSATSVQLAWFNFIVLCYYLL